MKRPYQLLLAMLMLIGSVAFAMELPRYEYWFDNDYDSRGSGVLPSDSCELDISVPALEHGLHAFNIQMLDTAGNRGSIFRRQFIVSDVTPGSIGYEYWFDGDSIRTSGVLADDAINFTADVPDVRRGAHTFTLRLRDGQGNWGAPFSRIFYTTEAGADAKGYEYWIDNDFDHKTSGDMTGGSVSFEVDIDSISTGYHFLNVRLKDSFEEWGTVHREAFFYTATGGNMHFYEYWMDNDLDAKTEGTLTDGAVALDLDLANVPNGLHFLNFRIKDSLEQWGAPFRQYFYKIPNGEWIDSYQYWFDGDLENARTGKYPGGDGMALDISMEGVEKKGLHTFNIRYREVGGEWGAPFTRIFSFIESPDKSPMVGYRHWINGRDMGYVAFETRDTVSKLFDIDIPEDLRPQNGNRKYTFDNDTVSYACTDSIHVIIKLETEEGWCTPLRRDMPISQGHTATAREMKAPSYIKLKKPTDTEFHAVKFTADGSPLYVRADQEASLELFRDGVRTDSIGGAELKGIKELTLADGTYFGLIHTAPKNDANPSDSLTFHLMDTANKLRMPEIAFNENDSTVSINPMREGAVAYYTIDGTVPTAETGTLYTSKFRLDHNATVKAIATLPGLDIEDSDVAEYNVDFYSLPDPTIDFEDLKVVISANSDLPGVRAYYTLDGAEPTEESLLYEAPIDLRKDARVRARTYKDGYNPSAIVDYSFEYALHEAGRPEIDVKDDTVTITVDDEETEIYFNVNDSVAANMRLLEEPSFTMKENGTVYAQGRRAGYFASPVVSRKIEGKKLSVPALAHGNDSVTISHDRDDVEIWYVAGSTAVSAADIKANGRKYSGPIAFRRNGVVSAMATMPGADIEDSDVAVLAVDSYKVDAPSIRYSDRTVVITQSKEEGVSTRYTLDGSEPTAQSELYSAPISLSANATVRARSFKQDWNPSDVTDFIYTHSTYVTAPPAIGVAGGTVTLTATDAGSKIWYAVNDADPAKMKEYTAPFTIDGACVIHAQARKEGLFPSEVVSQEVKSYRLTYMVDNAVYKELNLLSGISITPEPAPSKEGHTFSGWDNVPETMPAHDVTVSGTFSVNSYRLTYMVDGEVYKTSQVAYGAALTAEADPTKEGHTFSGWQGLPETMPAHDVTVTGSFSVNSYRLTYMLDGEVYAEYTVEYGAAITPEADPVREGYTFSGWIGVPETMPARDVTVNGSFSNTVYKATFLIDGETIETRLIEFGAKVTTPDAPAKEGHTFAGWQDVPDTMPAHDITITGSYTVNTYTLTYTLDGKVYKTSQVAYGTVLTAEANPTKEGHTFSGWQGLPQKMPAHDVTVIGSFSVNNYMLTYMLDGEVYAEYTIEFGAAITPEPDPVREGYTFSGWTDVPETMPARDVTVNGSFSNTVYKATFVIDGETIETRLIEFGAEVTTPDVPAKEGHTFAGWQDVPDTMPAHDITITGSYSVNSYTLTYMVDGELYKDYTVEFGATITPEPEPSKEGHTFSGWDNVPETMPAHDVTVSGSFMEKPYSARPQISYDGRFVTIGCEDQEADILFTIDNADMIQASEYGDSFDAMGLHTIRAYTVRNGFNDSETATLEIMAYSDDEHAETAAEGHLAEAFGWMQDGMLESIADYSFSGPFDADDYAAIRGMKVMRDLDLTEVTSKEMPDEALKGMDLLTVRLPKATEAYGEGIFTGNDGLCAIFANSPAAIPAEAFGDFRNPNLLLYLTGMEGWPQPSAVNPAEGIDWLTNVIADGETAAIPLLTLTDAMPYFCPKDFRADEIRFTKSFSKRTSLGGISGWETMAVPFDVSEIRKGEFELVPFKDYDGDEDTRPFWLYTPNGTSWEKADAIEAHTPYLISMPNNEAYEPSYNITGDVTFIGGQQVVNATPQPDSICYKTGHPMWVNFSRIPAEEGLFVVNDNSFEGHVPGEVFAEKEHDVRPFECYVTASTARKVLAIFDSSDIETLRDFTLEIWSERYDLFIRSPYAATFRIFDLNGQLVRIVKADAGATVRVADLTPGIYFVGDRKVLVK